MNNWILTHMEHIDIPKIIMLCFKKKSPCSCNIIMAIFHVLVHMYSFKSVAILHKVWLWCQFSEEHHTLAVSVMTVPECGPFQLHLHWCCQRRVLDGEGGPFCRVIDGETHGDQHSECLSRPLLCFHFFLFLLAGSDLLTFLSNPIKKLSERH